MKSAYQIPLGWALRRAAGAYIEESAAPLVTPLLALPSMAMIPFATGAAAAGMLGMQAKKRLRMENIKNIEPFYADYRDNPTPLGDAGPMDTEDAVMDLGAVHKAVKRHHHNRRLRWRRHRYRLRSRVPRVRRYGRRFKRRRMRRMRR